MNALAETVIRPSGKVYQARKRASAFPYGDVGPSYGIVVVRTHDADVAVPLAYYAWRYFHMDGEPLPPPRIGWTRLIPWDSGGHGGDATWDSCTGHERGSVPCVWFDVRDIASG